MVCEWYAIAIDMQSEKKRTVDACVVPTASVFEIASFICIICIICALAILAQTKVRSQQTH